MESKETYGQTRGLSNLEMKLVGKLAITGTLLTAVKTSCVRTMQGRTYSIKRRQEPISRACNYPIFLPRRFLFFFVVFFSLNLSRIQIPTGTSVTNCNHKHRLMSTCRNDVDMFTCGRIVLSSQKRAHLD